MLKLITTAAIAVTLSSASYAQSASNDEMRNLTSNVLAGITGKAPEPVAPVEIEADAIKNLVEQAISDGQSDDYLAALINEAAAKGEIEVPVAMRTTDGAVDTQTLLASLVEKSLGEENEALPTEQETLEERYYVVVAGDSLAAISAEFYGSVRLYDRIFAANRDQLSSPDRIAVGQRLVIPR